MREKSGTIGLLVLTTYTINLQVSQVLDLDIQRGSSIWLLQGFFDWIFGVENLIHLFQRVTPRLDEENVDPGGLKNIPENIYNVNLPANTFQTDRRCIGVDEFRRVEKQVIQTHPLRAGIRVQTLDRVCNYKRIDSTAVEYPDKEDEGNGQVREGHRLRRMVLGSAGCQGNKTGTHRQAAEYEKLSAANEVTHQRANCGSP